MGRVLARLGRQLELGLASVDLSLSQYRMLGFLIEGEGAAARLAEKLAVSPPSVTAMVDGLIARGIVERRPDDTDRRRHQLTVTAAGRRLLASADAAVEEKLGVLFDHLGAADAASARGSIQLWKRALDRHRTIARSATSVGPR
jgi:long-chain acyl-CoA synthetase